jgi:uncharacterized membrane protein
MAEGDTAELPKRSPIQLRHKIIAYVVAWAIALLLTAPGLWALAWMFPLGLVAVVNRHAANARQLGRAYWRLRGLHCPRIFLLSLENDYPNGHSLRPSGWLTSGECCWLPRDDGDWSLN